MEMVGGPRLRGIGAVGMSVATMVAGGWFVAGRALAVGDANEARCPATTEASPGFRVSLPDCRAYEIVSEANSGDLTNVAGSYGFPEGTHVYYDSSLPTPGVGARNGIYDRFLATRTSSGWMQQAISLPQGEGPSELSLGEQADAEGVIFTGDFSEAFLMSPFQDPFEAPKLNETTGVGVYRLSLQSGAAAMMSLPDSGSLTQSMIETPAYMEFAEANGLGAFLVGGSLDGSRAFFVTTAKLVTAPGTPQDTHEASNEIYERTGDHTYLVGVLPDGSVPNCGAEVGQAFGTTVGNGGDPLYSYGAVAPNGANVVFYSPGPDPVGQTVPCNEGGLFLRDVVHGTTVPLPGSVFGGRAGTGAGEEEKIFTLGEGKIYEYHITSGRTVAIGEGDLLAYSTDGTRIYFLGPEEGIYVWREGETKQVPGTPAGGYRTGEPFETGGLIANGAPTDYGQTRNMPVASGGSSDGSHVLFLDTAKLTGYENEGHREAYVYDAETEQVTCISCKPNNKPPHAPAQLITEYMRDIGEQQYQTPSPPFISDDGSRAVFETTETLLPQDVNGTTDVYEWQRAGSSGCEESSSSYSEVIDGCMYLLSSGIGPKIPNEGEITNGAHLVGASENLNDVYIQTTESLLPGLDNASKLYDVRVDGGFPYAASSHGCEAGQCEPAVSEPASPGEPMTEAFAGPGNRKAATAHRRRKRTVSAQKRRLMRALRACRRHRNTRRRIICERAARRRFGGTARRAHGRSKGAR